MSRGLCGILSEGRVSTRDREWAVDYRDQTESRFEMLMRKVGHDPFGVYVTRGHIPVDSMRCRRCGYQRRIGLVDEDQLAPCLVEGEYQGVDRATSPKPTRAPLRAATA